VPGDTGSMPGGARSMPADARSMPGDARSMLGGAGSMQSDVTSFEGMQKGCFVRPGECLSRLLALAGILKAFPGTLLVSTIMFMECTSMLIVASDSLLA